MTWRTDKKARVERRKNLQRHGALSASASLPEAHDTRYARRLIYTVLATVLAILIWAGNTPVDEITSGHGTIQTRTLAEQVEHPDGGIVADIHVEKGQRVTAGTPLLRFDTGALEREMGKLRASRTSLLAERDRIAFLLEYKGAVPEFQTLDELDPSELLFWAEQSYLEAQLNVIASKRRAIASVMTVLVAREANI